MYVEKKKIGKNEYNYLKVSVRRANKVATKTVAYLGKAPMSQKDIKSKIAEIPKSKIDQVKQQIKESMDLNKQFFDQDQLKELDSIKNDFKNKLRKLDKRLINDMFKDFKTYYIYNTNSIEGNTLTLEETNLLLNEDKSSEGKELKEIYDHINEKETFDFILKNKPVINNELIIKLHSMLLNKIDNRIGNYRTHDVRVFGAGFETSPAEYVKTDMTILLKWYDKNKSQLHPLILAALFHEKFERIHPFYDGNGRTGRILANLILISKAYPPVIVENSKRKEYYKVLSIAHKAPLNQIDLGCYKPIVDFFYKELLSTNSRIFAKWG